jgi:hypothetical protein
MKSIKLLFSVFMLLFMAISCEKSAVMEEVPQQKADFILDDIQNTVVWQGECDKPYNIQLLVRQQQTDGTWLWIWGIQNLSSPSVADLARFSFQVPSCVKILKTAYAYQGVNGGLQTPFTTSVAVDAAYSRCSPSDVTGGKAVLSYPVVTNGTNTTYLVLVVDKEYALDVNGTAYFKNSGGCGTTCFPGIKDDCNAVSCSFSQGRYFASPHAWPVPTVTVGGKTYTEAEGRALWDLKGPVASTSDARKAFFQVAAIKLSATTISSNASVWADVKIVEDWLATQPKLTAMSLSQIPKNKAVGEAGGRIGNWIDANHCK